MIGIFIGIAAVVALISLGQGFQRAINDQFEKLGSDRVIVTAGSGEFGPMGSSMSASQLYEKDVEAVRTEALTLALSQGARVGNDSLGY